jgi:NodT family efflux transporter outer membrane factor (OMF) lipoprotein
MAEILTSKSRVFAGLLSTVLVTLCGCAVGPRYARPPAPAPPEFKETPPNWKVSQPSNQVLRGNWWEIYQDPQLNELEEKVQVSNQTLKAAQAQFEQARALLRYYRADLYPTVSAGASATRERFSTHRPLATSTVSGTTNDLVLSADMSYEPDVWGRVRSNVAAYRANAQTSFADLESVSLSLHAELATDYFQTRELDGEAQVLDSTVASYQRALDLTQSRYQGGVASAVDVAQAETQLETASAQDIDVKAARTQFEHAITVLIGVPAPSFTLQFAALNAVPPVIPPGLPSQLLERRPDIAATERQMAAANANIGVARAVYFPLFSFPPAAGFESTSISNWLTGPSGFASVGISAAVTVFDVGRRRALTDEARAAYNQAVANYQQTVLTAYQEVEDNLAELRLLEQEAATQAAAVSAAERYLGLAQNRYKGGVTSYLEVTTAQTTALSDERIAVQIAGRRMVDSVLLIKALGGGFDAATLSNLNLTARTQSTPPAASASTGSR